MCVCVLLTQCWYGNTSSLKIRAKVKEFQCVQRIPSFLSEGVFTVYTSLKLVVLVACYNDRYLKCVVSTGAGTANTGTRITVLNTKS